MGSKGLKNSHPGQAGPLYALNWEGLHLGNFFAFVHLTPTGAGRCCGTKRQLPHQIPVLFPEGGIQHRTLYFKVLPELAADVIGFHLNGVFFINQVKPFFLVQNEQLIRSPAGKGILPVYDSEGVPIKLSRYAIFLKVHMYK